MSRQETNQKLLQTAFLYGGNAAYIDELYARYQQDPASVDAEWAALFADMNEDGALVEKNARGASWQRPNWPVPLNGELVSALDGNWAQVESAVGEKIRTKSDGKSKTLSTEEVNQATRDSVRAIMMIRAYRMRGHLKADLDPLHLERRGPEEELHPSHYGFTDADWDRPIFLDNVLGLEFGTVREIVAILERPA